MPNQLFPKCEFDETAVEIVIADCDSFLQVSASEFGRGMSIPKIEENEELLEYAKSLARKSDEKREQQRQERLARSVAINSTESVNRVPGADDVGEE